MAAEQAQQEKIKERAEALFQKMWAEKMKEMQQVPTQPEVATPGKAGTQETGKVEVEEAPKPHQPASSEAPVPAESQAGMQKPAEGEAPKAETPVPGTTEAEPCKTEMPQLPESRAETPKPAETPKTKAPTPQAPMPKQNKAAGQDRYLNIVLQSLH